MECSTYIFKFLVTIHVRHKKYSTQASTVRLSCGEYFSGDPTTANISDRESQNRECNKRRKCSPALPRAGRVGIEGRRIDAVRFKDWDTCYRDESIRPQSDDSHELPGIADTSLSCLWNISAMPIRIWTTARQAHTVVKQWGHDYRLFAKLNAIIVSNRCNYLLAHSR